MQKQFIAAALISLITLFIIALFWPPVLWGLLVVLPIVVLGIYDMLQTRHTIWRNFPVLGRGRGLLELIRPMIRQYFIESDTSGVPVNRVFRSVVYQRAKGSMDTVPYGTRFDVYRVGYEWIGHSLAAENPGQIDPDLRISIGGNDCRHPYNASILNISAMSFGALSRNAILALNGGAKKGGFAQNTGEGGLSPYHFENAGDLIWQVGTGYFGCRDRKGRFHEEQFKEKAAHSAIKMIEIKLSQGAKPGHGGVLPACKNTPEIAQIRGVEPYIRIDSPATHSTFSNPIGLMLFVQKLRDLSGGKPVGFKLCMGRKAEFMGLCKAMIETGICPDFITVDGGEGGTGAAPLEYSNSIGMPLAEGLAFVSDCLIGFDLKKNIKLIASGKIFTGFHIIKRLCLGADLCNSARGMMLAMGCIQSLQCNTNACPTGITTQNPALINGLVVTDKIDRVANFHKETVSSVADILAAVGLTNSEQLDRSQIFRRISQTSICSYDEIYPPLPVGCFLDGQVPKVFRDDLSLANAKSFDAALRICT